MADTSQADNPPHSNGITDGMDEEDRSKMRPADIDADVREMERRKRVEMIMSSKLFREELERIIETQLKDGSGTTGLMQQISDMMGVSKHAGNVFKNSNCVVPINDIRGIEAMGYAKGEKILRCKLAAVFRLIDLYGWTQGTNTIITARLNQDEEHFLVNPYGMLFHEITASSLIKVAMQGNIIEQGTTNFPVNITAFSLHAAIHAVRPDLKCIIYVHTPSVIAVSALKCGLLPISQEAVVIGDVSVHPYVGGIYDPEEKEKIARNLGPNNKVLLLTNQGAVCCGETIEEAFFNARNTVLACESQLKLMPVGLENLIVLDDETRKKIYDAAHKPPESTPRPDQPSILEGKVERKWRVGGVEFEALMRMLDNAGFRTGYIYRHPLIKGEPPRPKNDVEVPPAVSSLGYLLEEEELYRQGLWKKLEGGRKGNDRTRWLNSPNVYQKVEILETGTPDPKKITKWVADGSPTHSSSTPVKIDSALQFVPKNTNPKEFKQLQQQIKDYRRADKISAGPQSHILEGVTWEEARKMQDASVTQTGDHVVLMGAASKGIIQRGYQHNATMYKSPYAKNPFDSVTDEELDEYKKVVEKKSKGEYDTDYSESEGLSSSQINKRIDLNNYRSPTSETEEESRDEPQVLRIETKQAPRPSQPEVVLSDVERSTAAFINAERATTNNYRSVKVVEIYKKASAVGLLQKHYRTNGFGGLPRGSYAIPNPVHFHIAHYGQTNMSLRPTFVRRQNPTYNTNVHFNENRPHVTISIGNAHECTFNVSMQTLRDFIYPFATALNMENLPRQNTKSAQTSYVQYSDSSDNSEIQEITTYTPLPFKRKSQETLGENENTFIKEDGSDYEMDIMKRLHENLVQDLSRSRETTSSENDDDYTKHNVSHLVHHYEGLADLAQEVANKVLSMTANFSLFEEVIFDALNILKHLPFSSVSDEELIQLIGPSNAKGQESRSSSLSVQTSTRRTDEGFNETQNSSNTTCESKIFDESSVDENVNRLSELIYNYLIRHCYEVKELILFPEVLYDQNIHKLFVEMRRIYQQYFLNMDNEQKNELRIKIGISVIHKLELNEKDVSDANDSVVSDKVFSISEFVSDILDQFFENFVKFDDEKIKTDDTKLMEKNIHHSTPRRLSYLNRKQNEEVTAFKQRESEKSKSESYWIAISPTSSPSVSIQRVNKVINIDDIPLRPPSDLFESSFRSTQLSPIPEEPRYNLFNVSTDDHKLLQKSDCSARTLHDDYEIFGYMTDECKISDGENGENKENRDDSISYYSFKQPEVNVVVCNSATFHRTKTINCESYVQSSNIIFERQPLADLPKTSLNKSEDDSDDGDWMGYEMARF